MLSSNAMLILNRLHLSCIIYSMCHAIHVVYLRPLLYNQVDVAQCYVLDLRLTVLCRVQGKQYSRQLFSKCHDTAIESTTLCLCLVQGSLRSLVEVVRSADLIACIETTTCAHFNII
jgi:hypothetical protein